MAVDIDFYKDIYGGTDYPDIDRLLKRAAEFIDGKISRLLYSDFEVRQYNFAVCAQAEYMGYKGGYEAWFSETESGIFSSVHLGSFSLSIGGSSARSSSENIPGLSFTALNYLEKAGLLYRGCTVCR